MGITDRDTIDNIGKQHRLMFLKDYALVNIFSEKQLEDL